MREGIIWVRDSSGNFELDYCHETKKFYLTQLTFGITSETTKENALRMCEKSGWDKQDYEKFFQAA